MTKKYPIPVSITVTPRESDLAWNRPSRWFEKNCYAYAVSGKDGLPRLGLPNKPGNIGDIDFYESGSFVKSMIQDGLIPAQARLGELPLIKKGYYLIAAVVDNVSLTIDCHFYRRDADGAWSHKAPHGNVLRIDGAGKPIVEPAQADHHYGKETGRCNYIFTGYFYVPDEGVKVEEPMRSRNLKHLSRGSVSPGK